MASGKFNLARCWRQALARLDNFSLEVLLSMGSLVVLAISGVLLNMIITLARGTSGLGVFNQVFALYILASQLATVGLQNSVLKQISYASDDCELQADIATSALLLVVLCSVPVMVGGFLATGLVEDYFRSADVGAGFRFVLPGLLFFGLNKVLINILNGLQQMKAYAVFRSLRFILLLGSVIILIALGVADSTIPLALTLTEIVLFLTLFVLIYRRLLPFKPINSIYARCVEHLSYGSRSMLGGALLELNTRMDVIILGYFTTDGQVGIYSFAAMLAEGFAQFPVAFRWNLDPILGQHFVHGALDQIQALIMTLRRRIFLSIGGLGILAVAGYPLGYWLLFGPTHLVVSWSIFALIVMGVVVNAPYAAFKGLILQGGHPMLFTFLTFCLFVSDTVLNVLFIPYLGILGAALVTAITFMLDAVYLRLATRRLFAIRI
ncbi:MAG: oligosaccharide flippase family protein [Chloroflexi bacterium]|nr:oligosaccharide flippase family protein [Chloroflexota bacterium]